MVNSGDSDGEHDSDHESELFLFQLPNVILGVPDREAVVPVPAGDAVSVDGTGGSSDDQYTPDGQFLPAAFTVARTVRGRANKQSLIQAQILGNALFYADGGPVWTQPARGLLCRWWQGWPTLASGAERSERIEEDRAFEGMIGCLEVERVRVIGVRLIGAGIDIRIITRR